MKRFFTFLMAIWALLSISQTVKAADEVYLLTAENINGAEGNYQIPSKHQMDFVSDDTYEIKIESSSPDDIYFRVGVNSSTQKQFYPSKDGEVLEINEEGGSSLYKSAEQGTSSSNAWKVSFDKKTYEYITIHVVISGQTKVWVDGKKKSSGTVTPPTPLTNPIDKRKYSEGYYLVGNFFNFDGGTINYKDAVFKFKQQKDDAEGNAVYMLEIPATLTARAQVMSVDATGTPVAVYGPGEVLPINNSTLPVGADSQTATTEIKDLKSNIKIEDGTNYWDMTTRRTKRDGVGLDGSYKYYITVDKATGEPSKWEIKYTDLKRVAYLLSTNPLSSALTVGSTRAKNTFEGESDKTQANFNSGKYFGSLYMDKDDEYYGVSNDLHANDDIRDGHSYDGYGAIENDIDRPTYNKLFLFGNDGLDVTTGNTKAAANWGTFKCSTNSGVYVIELNTNKGDNDCCKDHGGTGAEIQKKDSRDVITSLSMVGPAIPGTTTGNKWDWASPVADMDFDVSENCYKLTIATTEENRNQVFRFVGNHTQKINWFENSVDQLEKAAEYKADGTFGSGHTASPSDPNEVSYTQNGLDPKDKSNDDNLNIIWNRPAGTWTVRFHIYTYLNGNDPSFRYFYTINKNSNLELRDFKDVVYMSEDNVRNIKNRGNYQYFRTWSDDTAWKRPENVDVFVVSKVTPADENHNVAFELTKINKFDSSEDVIPAKTGVILALKENVEVPGAVFHTRKSLITYNTLDIQLEQAKNKELSYTGDNLLEKSFVTKNIPTADEEKVNYLFGFYHAIHGLGLDNAIDKQGYKQNDYLLGFWISNGKGLTYANSSYLPIKKEIAEKLNLGTSNDFSALQNQSGSAKKIPALFFDFGAVDNDVTGIQGVVESKTVLDGKYYTLSGQQVEHPTVGGIYIHNGKKYVIK